MHAADEKVEVSPDTALSALTMQLGHENTPHPEQHQSVTPVRKRSDPNLVSWTDARDPQNPRNWTSPKKWRATVVVSSFSFVSPVASVMIAPALPQINKDLDVPNSVLSQMMLSIFLLAYAVGPLFLGPLSEVYGRVKVLQLANLFFLVFNLCCGFAQSTTQMILLRFLARVGGSVPLPVGGGM